MRRIVYGSPPRRQGLRARGRRSPQHGQALRRRVLPEAAGKRVRGLPRAIAAAIDNDRCGVAAPLEATLQISGALGRLRTFPAAARRFRERELASSRLEGCGAGCDGEREKTFRLLLTGVGVRVYIPLIDAAADTGCGAERFPGSPGWGSEGPGPPAL